MSLNLDNRQRAMLREMGVRLWQPPAAAVATASPAPDALPSATDLIAAGARNTSAGGTNGIHVATEAAAAPALRAAPPAPRSAPTVSTAPVGSMAGPAAAGWQLGAVQTLYANAALPDAHTAGPRWLMLVETPAASLRKPVFDPFDGDAGKLLGNMLRAAGLHKSGQPGEAGPVMLAPLARLAAGGVNPAALPNELTTLIAQTRPDVIVVMGRLAAQAVLQSSEPLGKLRVQVHQLHGAKTVVTYDAAVLLRSPLDKAKAWEDLCLAIDVSQQAFRGQAESALG
jgi:uracil-DNA glycosylase